jgi:cell wall-associated NlpC family hydrolase
MRPHRTWLKDRRLAAESPHMQRGGSGLRRRVAALTVMVTLGVSLLAEGATADAGGPGSLVRTDPQSGEGGTGLPGLPIVVGSSAPARAAIFKWSDLDASDAWARPAIDFVARTNSWMRDFAPRTDGSYPFRPDAIQTRKYLARALVRAFAPGATVDPRITFSDLDPSHPFFRWANIAVGRGWMGRASAGRFAPDKPVTMVTVHRVIVMAVGLRSTARRLSDLHSPDGMAFATPANFGTTMLGMRLGLRYPSSQADHDVTPRMPLSRAQVAYSLYRAKTLAGWVVPWLQDQYRSAVLPRMTLGRRAIVRWGLQYVGYPYIWAGEWGFETPPPPAFGGQPIPGFDCSGIAWWALRADDGSSWEISPPRPYQGWALPQRTSADMARFGVLRFEDLLPGDLAFYDGNDDGTVDHVDVYLGNDLALDSSTSVGGVTLMYVGPGSWYRDHFVRGRRIVPTG